MALIDTFSRGGIVSLFPGLIPVMVCTDRPWRLNRVIVIVASLWIVMGVALFLKAEDRLDQGIASQDRSITNRLMVWSAAPRMMCDAPWGWGLGNSGSAYMQWYQPIDHAEEYRTLVNSHLTWLVELSWPLRFLYLFAWFSIFLLCWPADSSRILAIVLGIWISFAICSTFSSVAESPCLWIIPGSSLALVLAIRLRFKLWPRLISWLIPPAISVTILGLVIVMGWRGSHVRPIDGGVVLGTQAVDACVIIDPRVMGSSYGHYIRRFLAVHQEKLTIAIIESPDSTPSVDKQVVVLAGRLPSDVAGKSHLLHAREIVLLNPRFFPQELGERTKDLAITVFFGEFSQSPAENAWKATGKVATVSGVGDFLPDWPQLVFSGS